MHDARSRAGKLTRVSVGTFRRAARPVLLRRSRRRCRCGRRSRATLPTGTGTALPDFATPHREATADCLALTSLSASIKLSGKAGGTNFRPYRLGVCCARGDRLEGYPRISFGGRPFFILVAGDAGTRYSCRAMPVPQRSGACGDRRGPHGRSPRARRSRSIVGGCGLQTVAPSGGRSFEQRMGRGRCRRYVRLPSSDRRPRGGRRAPRSAERHLCGFRRRAWRDGASPGWSIHGAESAPISRSACRNSSSIRRSTRSIFDVEVPPDAVPLTLEELRSAGPLGDAKAAPTPAAIEAGS